LTKKKEKKLDREKKEFKFRIFDTNLVKVGKMHLVFCHMIELSSGDAVDRIVSMPTSSDGHSNPIFSSPSAVYREFLDSS
jgi:hypothetical protein